MPTKRLIHYIEARLHGNAWAASCPTARTDLFSSTRADSLEAAVRSVTADVAKAVGTPVEDLTIIVESDPSAEAMAAAPQPGEPYRIRVCATEAGHGHARQEASFGSNVVWSWPDKDKDIPGQALRQLADEYWLTEREQAEAKVELCRHPAADDWLSTHEELRTHAWSVNERMVAAMKLRLKERLDALPRLSPLEEWATEQASEVITEQGHHRYCGPEFTNVSELAAAFRRAAEILENADPRVLERLRGLGFRALLASATDWRALHRQV